jgi:hypothetical protein
MRPKHQKHSVLKLAGRIIPRNGGFNTPQLAAEPVSKACCGVYTRDSPSFQMFPEPLHHTMEIIRWVVLYVNHEYYKIYLLFQC